MKKLLLVLAVVAMASFLLVGCFAVPDGTEGEGEGEGEPEVLDAITIEDEYLATSGVTFVGCEKDVTVTLSEAVETDYVVYVAIKNFDGTTTTYDYDVPATPNADRTIWTVTGYDFGAVLTGDKLADCSPICLVALVKHPCCPGEEGPLRVVTVDCEAPYADLAVTFKDCLDPCAETDECNPYVGGAYFEFSSREAGLCSTTDCCGDDCSGLASWTLVVDPDPCAPACKTVYGSACPVEGVVECGCLPYAAGDDEPTLTYDVTYTLLDNVGNKFEDTWTITVDSGNVTNIIVPLGNGGDVTMGTPVYIYEDKCEVGL